MFFRIIAESHTGWTREARSHHRSPTNSPLGSDVIHRRGTLWNLFPAIHPQRLWQFVSCFYPQRLCGWYDMRMSTCWIRPYTTRHHHSIVSWTPGPLCEWKRRLHVLQFLSWRGTYLRRRLWSVPSRWHGRKPLARCVVVYNFFSKVISSPLQLAFVQSQT